MKIDQAFIYYLLRFKELPLQGIGVFTLEGSIPEPSDPDKPFVIPEDAISFTYNPRIGEDPDLVHFISEMTGKIKPLASADLDSYLTLGRQFINIGKPLILPNIGTIEKTNTGELIFKGGQHIMERLTPNKVSTEVEEAEPKEAESFSDFPAQPKNAGRGILYLIILIIVGLTAWALWKYGFQTDEKATITHTDIEPVSDSPGAQSISPKPDSLSVSPGAETKNDTIGFRIVVGFYDRLAGEKRLKDMLDARRNVVLYTDDSIRYKVAEPFPDRPLSDSSFIKDSMRAYYGDRNFVIEKLPAGNR